MFPFFLTDRRPHVDISQHHVMCLTWPNVAGCSSSSTRTKDALLMGRIDGSVAIIEVKDSVNFNRVELEHCKREGMFTFYF